MSFLPLIDRELREASRRKRTFLLRSGTALMAMLISGPAFIVAEIAARGSSAGASVYLFQLLAHYIYILCLLAGIFFASDCLSEERREGTLGLLFLTDLKGRDVVLGKLAGISLNALYALLAVLPVLALPLLSGGVTGGEFWRMNLALVNALFLSVAAAMWFSSMTTSAFRSMSNTFIFLLVMGAVLPAFGHYTSVLNRLPWVKFLTPYEAFHVSSDLFYRTRAALYWKSLGATHLLGWFFMVWTSWRLPRSISAGTEKRAGFWAKFAGGGLLLGLRRRNTELMEKNPVLWLLADSGRIRALAWGISILGSVILLLIMLFEAARFDGLLNLAAALPFFFLLKILCAMQASRFFVEARRTGSLELICSTPLTNEQIIQGQWLALRRIFLAPVTVLLITLLTTVIFSIGQNPSVRKDATVFLLTAVHLGGTVMDFFAVGWFCMWLALAGKKPGFAPAWAILFILIMPWITYCLPQIMVDVIFIAVTKSKLREEFRMLASGQRRAFSMGSL